MSEQQLGKVGNLVWDSMASALDQGNREAAAALFADYSRGVDEQFPDQARDMKRNLIKIVDEKENDGVGDDLAVKYDANGVPKHFVMLPHALNMAAKDVAKKLDEGNTPAAAEEFAAAVKGISNSRDQQFFVLAIDAYEKDGIGRDVNVQNDSKGNPSSFDIDFTPTSRR